MFAMTLAPAKDYLLADLEVPLNLPVMIRLEPQQASAARAVALAVVVDASYSMTDAVAGGGTKIDRVVAALEQLADDRDLLRPEDELALIRFGSEARLLHGGPVGDRQALRRRIAELRRAEGSTNMVAGLELGLEAIARARHRQSRLVLFTDGEADSAGAVVSRTLPRLAGAAVRVVSFGVGDRYNEILLEQLADGSNGDYYHLADLSAFAALLANQIIDTRHESALDASLRIAIPDRGVAIKSLYRLRPTLARIQPTDGRWALGNLRADDETILLLDLSLQPRPAGVYRVVEVSLTLGDGATLTAPGARVAFGHDRDRVAGLASVEAWDYARQRGCHATCREAANAARDGDLQGATERLVRARDYARQAGNAGLTQTVDRAVDELRRTQHLSGETIRRVVSDSRTKTVRSRHAGPGVHRATAARVEPRAAAGADGRRRPPSPGEMTP